MLTDSLLNKNFDMNLAPHSTVGWLEGQNSPDDACSPTFRRLLDELDRLGGTRRGRIILLPRGEPNNNIGRSKGADRPMSPRPDSGRNQHLSQVELLLPPVQTGGR
jgi:hypothetical protein